MLTASPDPLKVGDLLPFRGSPFYNRLRGEFKRLQSEPLSKSKLPNQGRVVVEVTWAADRVAPDIAKSEWARIMEDAGVKNTVDQVRDLPEFAAQRSD